MENDMRVKYFSCKLSPDLYAALNVALASESGEATYVSSIDADTGSCTIYMNPADPKEPQRFFGTLQKFLDKHMLDWPDFLFVTEAEKRN
jgi:hypothetical protein